MWRLWIGCTPMVASDGGGDQPSVWIPPTAARQTHDEMVSDRAAVRHPGDGGGRWRVIDPPSAVPARSRVTLTMVYTAGPHGVVVGGGVVLLPSPFWGWSAPQTEVVDAPGYTEVVAPPGIDLTPRRGSGQLWLEIGGRPLSEGEEVQFVYTGSADRFAETGPAIWIGVDADGDGVRSVVPTPVSIPVVAGPPGQVVAVLPSALAPGEAGRLSLAVLDDVGNAFGRSAVTLRIRAHPSLGLPEAVAFTEADEGLAILPIQPSQPGVFTVEVIGPGEARTVSNPMVVRAGAPPILWGDLQIHSGVSDGTGRPAEVWRYARDVAALDVAAITDHDHWGMRFLDASPDLEAVLDAAATDASVPGRFVALHGYEYTHWLYGHRHVLYFDGPGPVHSSMDPATDTPAALWGALRGRKALTVPHHPAGGPVALDWSQGHDPELEPLVEIASVHGQSEDPTSAGAIYGAVPGTFAVDALRRGARFGFLGSTDGHDGHPGLAHLAGGASGLAGILAAAPTPDAIHRALLDRRVYATNGPRIVLRVAVGGAPMGASRPAGAPAEVAVRVVGTAAVDRIELVQRAGVVGSRTGSSALLHASWTLDDPQVGDFVYVRVVQHDGGMAWSSPVFFD